MVAVSGRVPVQARSIATRAALLDAALECLVADGYASLTTNDVARRAGVSRGAQLHHFASKAELLTAAVDHLLMRRIREFRADIDAIEGSEADVDALLALVWAQFQGPAFVAWVELWLAARTDRDLAAKMVEVDRRFSEESRALGVALLKRFSSVDPGRLALLRDFAFALMTGVAFTNLVPRGQRDPAEHLAVLRDLATSMLDALPAKG